MINRIECSAREQLTIEMIGLLEFNDVLLVSGQPLLCSPTDPSLPQLFYDQCPLYDDEPIVMQRVGVWRIPRLGHHHLSEKYLSEDGYPVVSGRDFSGNSVVFGIRAELQFIARPLDPLNW